MGKTVIQGLIIILLFFSTWFVLAQIDWITILKIHRVIEKIEEKLEKPNGEIFKESFKENENPFLINSIDSIVNKICLKNSIDD